MSTRSCYIVGIMALSAPAFAQPAPPVSLLSGRVLSAETGQPLVGAMLLIYRASDKGEAGLWQRMLTTDEAGRYECTVPADSYGLGIIAHGYVAQTDTLEIVSAEPVTRDYKLAPLREIIGRVVRLDGKPLASRTIRYAASLPEVLRTTVISMLRGRLVLFVDPMAGTTEVDQEGRFRLPNMVPEPLTLIVESPADGGALVNVDFPAQANADVGTVQLKPFIDISGVVMNGETNQPVPSAYVYVRPTDARSSSWEGSYYFQYTTTNAKGEFRFSKVIPHQAYSVYSYARGAKGTMRGTAEQTDFSEPGKQYSVTLTLTVPKSG